MAAGVVEMSTLSSLDVTSVAHIYKEVWKPIVGERLLIMNEVGNAQDLTAVRRTNYWACSKANK